MSRSAQKSLSWQWLAVLSTLLLFSGIGLLSIYALDEARNAGAAREMFLNKDYIVPTFNGELRTHKPPLHYFFMTLGYKIFGINAFGARFFSGFMGLLTLGLVYGFAKLVWNKKVAITSTLILLASVHFLLQMQMAVPDPYLIFLLTLSFLSFYLLWKTNERKYWWIFYIAVGFGVLAKGPIAIALPGLAGLLFLLFSRSFNVKTILRMNPFLGLPLSVAVAFPWFYLVHQKTNGAFTEGFFFEHNINRYSESFEGHNGSPFLTLAFVLLGFIPFVFFIPTAFAKVWKEKQPIFTYLFCVVISVIGFFMTSGTKLPNYTVPVYPAIALILGYYFSQHKGKKWQWIATIVWCFLFIIGGYIALQFDETLYHLKYLALFFAIPVIGAIIALLRPQNSFLTYVSAWMIFGWIFFTFLYPKIDTMNPIRQTIDQIDTEKKIVGYKIFNPAFVFALNQEIQSIESLAEMEKMIANNEGLVIVTRKSYWEELQAIPNLRLKAEAKDIFETPTTIIVETE